MKKVIPLLILSFVLVSCSQPSQDELLISTTWVSDQPTADEGATESLTFQKDGNYILESGAVKVNGKWSRKNNDEILVIVEGMSSDNGPARFDKTANYDVRILDISKGSLHVLEKGEGDSWDSGFAREKKYKAAK